MSGAELFPCPCCGSLNLPQQSPGTYWICEICDWEDDPVQAEDLDYRGGANEDSLNEVRQQFREWRAAGFPREKGRRRRQPKPHEVGDL